MTNEQLPDWNDERVSPQSPVPAMSAAPAASAVLQPRLSALDIAMSAITALAGFGWLVLVLLSNEPGFFTGMFIGASIAGTLLMAASVLLARKFGGISLVLLCGVVSILVGGAVVLPWVLALPWVAYATARYGSRLTMAASGVFFGLLTVLVMTLLQSDPNYLHWVTGLFRNTVVSPGFVSFLLTLLALLLGLVPWLIGVGIRLARVSTALRESTNAAEAERAQAELVAAHESGQARLARDVHDVVGHSLAVILAQAESAQFLDEPAALQQTLANVATAARQSLGEVRQVLGAARGEGQHRDLRPWEDLIESVRAAGADVRVTTTGTARPLPPELEQVAYRVLQEMLTNALRHGDLAQPIVVEQAWEHRLRLRVRNAAAQPDGESHEPIAGVGLPGMRARVAAVGGDFDFSRTATSEGDVVSATAWLPLGASAHYQPARKKSP